jgi:hypothetical protein
MKIALLSLSIAVLGFFALQALPEPGARPQLAMHSSDAEDKAATPRPVIVRGRH